MQRQERSREKAEKRKVRKEERIQRAASGAEGESLALEVDADGAVRPALAPSAGSGSDVDANPAGAGPPGMIR